MRVRDALDGLSFRADVRLDPDRDQMVGSVRAALEDDSESLILYVVSHGEVDVDDTRLDVVPACGRTGLGTNVGEWVSAAQRRSHPVLLLLDLCRSGRVARLPWLLQRTGAETTTWVIAAAGPDEDAFDGQFSRAVADVLGRLAVDGLGADPSTSHVSWEIVARRIGERVASYGGLSQQVHATPIDPAQPPGELPFFPNPRYAPDQVAGRSLDPPLREFLDHAHFLDRAGAHFTGRQRELRRLSLWLDGAADDRPIIVTGSPGAGKSALLGVLVCAAHPRLAEEVPSIRARMGTRARPSVNGALAAVHARGRDLPRLVRSIAEQLGLPAPWRDGMPGLSDLLDESINGRQWTVDDIVAAAREPERTGWTSAALVASLADLAEPPAIVVDALDEALDPVGTVNDLLLPLVEAGVCRLMVATRRHEWFDERQLDADVLDLDAVDPAELQTDLEHHLMDRLAEARRYRDGSARRVRESLAQAMADRLAHASRDWGAFLLAEIFLRYLDAMPLPADTDDAGRRGAAMPTGLPEVLELHLGTLGPDQTMRWALGAIAFGKGDGMPAEVIATLVGADVTDVLAQGTSYLRTSVDTDGTTLYRLFHDSLDTYLRSRHDATRVYTRLVAGVLSWRAAPPYLLRHAIEHAADVDRVDDLLTDPEFLVMAEPRSLVRFLGAARSAAACDMAAVYRSSSERHHNATPDERREVLAIDACRNGSTALARTFTRPGLVPRWATGALVHPALRDVVHSHVAKLISVGCLRVGDDLVAATSDGRTVRLWDLRQGCPWQPARITLDRRYAEVSAFVADGRPLAAALEPGIGVRLFDLITGEPLDAGIESPEEDDEYFALTAGDDNGAYVIAGGIQGAVHTWPIPSDDDAEPSLLGYHPDCVYFANSFTTNGTTMFVTGDKRGQINIWLDADDWSDAELVGHESTINGAAGVAHRGDIYFVSTSNDGTVRLWTIASDRPDSRILATDDMRFGPVACAVVLGRPVALVGHGDDIEAWDLLTREQLGDPLPHTDMVSDIQCFDVDGRPYAVSTAHDGFMRIWHLETVVAGRQAVRPGHTEPINAATVALVEGRAVVVAGGGEHDSMQDGVGVWDLTDGTPVGGRFGAGTGWVSAVATVEVDGAAVAVLATGETNALGLWDIATGSPFGRPLEGHQESVHDVAAATVGGRPVVVSGGDDGALVWDVATGGRTPLPVTQGDVVDCVAVGDDGGTPYAATWAEDDVGFTVWDLARCAERWHVEPDFAVWRVACATMSGRPVVVAGGEGLGVFDPRTGGCLRTIVSAIGWQVRNLACGVLRGRAVAVTGCSDMAVRLWDLATGECLAAHAVPDTVEAIALAPDGGIVVCYEREIVVLDWTR